MNVYGCARMAASFDGPGHKTLLLLLLLLCRPELVRPRVQA